MKRTALRRKSRMKRSGRIRRKARSAQEMTRIYGPAARRLWVKSLPCVYCGIEGFSENAHVVSGGKGRKSDASNIVPMCSVFGNACHRKFDTHTYPFSNAATRAEVIAHAAYIDAAWNQLKEDAA